LFRYTASGIVQAVADFDELSGEIRQRSRTAMLVDLAERQHGVVSLKQLRQLGWRDGAIRSRVAGGHLHRIHRGVFAVGRPTVAIEGGWMAAVLACGPGALLSHRSAAALWELLAAAGTVIEVISPRRTGRGRPGLAVHYSCCLMSADRAVVRGIPCTSVARTLLDLAAVVDLRALERACDQAEVLRLFDLRAVNDVLARTIGHPGARALKTVIAAANEPAFTRTEIEERFLALCREACLPHPEVNAQVVLGGGEAYEVDFLWRRERLIVETDGRETHGTRRAFERDRRRDQRLMLHGWRVARFTWRQVVYEPAELVRTLVALLATSGPSVTTGGP
jgi:very-short-patch-repair endonuclease